MQFAERQKKKSSTLVGTALFRGYIPLANVLSQQQKTSLANSKVSTNKKKKENNNIKLKYLSPSCAAVGCVHFKLHADQISGMQQTVLFENTEPSSCKGHMRKERANERCIE